MSKSVTESKQEHITTHDKCMTEDNYKTKDKLEIAASLLESMPSSLTLEEAKEETEKKEKTMNCPNKETSDYLE